MRITAFLWVVFLGFYCPSSFAQDENEEDDASVVIEHAPFGRRMVSINPGQLIFWRLGLGYEVFNMKENISYRFSFVTGFTEPYFEIGTEFKFYLTKPNIDNYQFGHLNLGPLQMQVFAGPHVLLAGGASGFAAGTKGYLGLAFQHKSGFNFSLYGGPGAAFWFVREKSLVKDPVTFIWSLNVVVGYRFRARRDRKHRNNIDR